MFSGRLPSGVCLRGAHEVLGAGHAEAERVVRVAHRLAGVGHHGREAQLRPGAAAALHAGRDLLQTALDGGLRALGPREGKATAAASTARHAQRGGGQREAFSFLQEIGLFERLSCHLQEKNDLKMHENG